jgi:hypothetical protein
MTNSLRYTQPWNKQLWYWEVAELKQFVQQNGVSTNNLHCEGLKAAARFLRGRPNMGHEEVHNFALQVQEQRVAKFPQLACSKYCACQSN